MGEQRVIVRLRDQRERIVFERTVVVSEDHELRSFALPVEGGLFMRARVECEFDPPLTTARGLRESTPNRKVRP